jgi:glycosyltransferase involved in cell wall biosynthesis
MGLLLYLVGVNLDVSVVLPCLNEEQTLGICIDKAKQVFREQNWNGEVIVVVDNATVDDSAKIAKQHGATVILETRRGPGYACLTGFSVAKGKYVVLADSDDTYDLMEMPKLLEPVKKGEADLVLGSRMKGTILPGAMPWLHRYFGNPFQSLLFRLFFGSDISDEHSGFRAISKKALENLDLKCGGFDYTVEMLIKAVKKGLRIKEVPITYHPRIGTVSKLRAIPDGWRHLRFMLLYSPDYLFMIPGLAMFIIGLTLMILLLGGQTVIFGVVLDIHPMVLGSLLTLAGYQVIFFGLYARAYAVANRLEESDRLVSFISRHVPLERGLLIGVVVIIVGIAINIGILSEWLKGGGELSEMRSAIFALTLVILGVQTFSSAFFLSILGIEKKN